MKVSTKACQGDSNWALVGFAVSGTRVTVTSIVTVSTAAMLAIETPRP